MSQQNNINAKTKGLEPAFLNLSKLVSAPNAVIAMVRRKVSKVLMPFLTLSERGINELSTITTKNKIANHGVLILPGASLLEALRATV